MGLLSSLVSKSGGGAPEDAKILSDIISAMCSIDGKLDPTESSVLEGLHRSIPQLRSLTNLANHRVDRKGLLEDLAKVQNEKLRKQIYVLGVEMACASGGVNESEDQFMEHVRKALRLEEAFAKQVIEVIALKYAIAP